MYEYLVIRKEDCPVCDGTETPYGAPDTCKQCDGRGYETPFVSLREALDDLLREPGAFSTKKLKGNK